MATSKLSQAERGTVRALMRIDRRYNLIALPLVAIWAAAAVLAIDTPSWPARLVCYAAIGAVIHALATLMHEAIHGNLFRRRALDRWVGFLVGAPSLLSFTAYAVTHRLHHKHTRTTLDPDEMDNVSSRAWVRRIVFYGWLVAGMPFYAIHVPLTALRRGTARERSAVIVELALIGGAIASMIALAAHFHAGHVVVHAWLAPLAFASAIGQARGVAEHTLTARGDPSTATRTITSTPAWSLVLLNLNYHLEHHLYPAVPWYNLPRLHALLRRDHDRAGAFVERSYVGFLWRAVTSRDAI